jgi:hypothetical protein
MGPLSSKKRLNKASKKSLIIQKTCVTQWLNHESSYVIKAYKKCTKKQGMFKVLFR